MNFNERFLKKIADNSRIFGEHMPEILLRQESVNEAINTLGENTIQSLAGIIGSDLGSETRKKVLKGNYETPIDELNNLMKSFKNNMSLHDVYVSYGQVIEEPNKLIIQANKCLFTNEGINCMLCNYSRKFIEAYFNARIISNKSIREGENYCEFVLEFNYDIY